MTRIGDMLRMDGNGRFTSSGSGRSIADELARRGDTAIANSNKLAEESVVQVPSMPSRLQDRAIPEDAKENERVTLICKDSSLCGYYLRWQLDDIPERLEDKGRVARLLVSISDNRRFALLRRSYDNPMLTPKQNRRIKEEVFNIAERRPGLLRLLPEEERPPIVQQSTTAKETVTHETKHPLSSAQPQSSSELPKAAPTSEGKLGATQKKAKALAKVLQTADSTTRSVARDMNGCFLGVFSADEARELWPETKEGGGVIAVPRSFSFASATKTIALSKGFQTAHRQKRYCDSVTQAAAFVESMASKDAKEFWSQIAVTKLEVYDNANKPIARLLPRFLDEAVGNCWFLFSDSCAQVMSMTASGVLRKACRKVERKQNREFPAQEEKPQRSNKDRERDTTTSLPQPDSRQETLERALRKYRFVVLSPDGSVVYACGEKKGARVRPHILSMLPVSSFKVAGWGVQLERSLEELGYASDMEFARACAAIDGQPKTRTKPRTRPLKRPSVQGPMTPETTGPITFDGPENVLYVFKGSLSCLQRGHQVEAATGTIATLKRRPVTINVNYCKQCRKYYLGQREYLHYREKYGPILGNFSFPAQSSSGYGTGNLAQESPLMMCGYNVRQADGLTSKERQLILANIMDRGILSKPRVIDYLQFFIGWREGNPNMRLACQKWEEDLAFVRKYNIDRQRRFTIGGVMRYR